MNKLNSKLFASIVFILFGFYITEAQEDFNFAELLPEKFDKANIIEEEDYHVWGTNIL
mgnify:FL=1